MNWFEKTDAEERRNWGDDWTNKNGTIARIQGEKKMTTPTLEELLQLEEKAGEELMRLSKNGTANAGRMDALMSQMQELSTVIDQAQANQQQGYQQVDQSRIAELQAKQLPLLAEIDALFKEPTKYGKRIEELDRQVQEIETQIRGY